MIWTNSPTWAETDTRGCQMETAAKTATNSSENPKPTAKPKPTPKMKVAKVHVPAKAVLEKLVGKRVRYVGRNKKFTGRMVELKAVRVNKDAAAGFDVRLQLGDSAMYCSATSVKL